MAGKICSECGYENAINAQYCDECGVELLDNIIDNVIEENLEEKSLEENFPEIADTENIISELEKNQEEVEEKETPAQKNPVIVSTVLDVDEPVPQGVLIHKETETRLELPAEKTTFYIGRPNEEREIEVDLSRFPEAEVISRLHAMIIFEEENYYLEDAGSQNGTSLNGEIIKVGSRYRKQLNHGDTITFGKKRTINLTFEITE